MTGGFLNLEADKTALTEISVNNGRWDIVSSASLPAPLVKAAALTINNQVYLFGNFSKPEMFSLELLNDMNNLKEENQTVANRPKSWSSTVMRVPGLGQVKWETHILDLPSRFCLISTGSVHHHFLHHLLNLHHHLSYLLICYCKKINLFIPTSLNPLIPAMSGLWVP